MPYVPPTAVPPRVRPARAPGRGPRPTKWTALALGAVAVATVALDLPALVAALAVLVVAGCAGLDMWLARARPPAFSRSAVPVLARRVPVDFETHTDAHGARSFRLRQPAPPELAVVPPEQRHEDIRGRIVGRHRGVHRLPPAVVRLSGPLGLGTSDHTVGPSDEVTVFPDLPAARRLAAARRRGRTTDEGRIRSRLGLGTQFETIRDYSPNDDVRQVNWVATARVGRPMTNQYRVDENRDLLCVVDAGRLMAAPLGEATRLDVALDAVAALVVAAEEAGDRVGCLGFDARVARQLAPRRRGAEAVVGALFDLEPTEVESDYERAFMAVNNHKRALVTLFTDLADDAAARTLLAAAPVLMRRHVVMVVTSKDPDLERAIATPPQAPIDVFGAAAAVEVLASRDRAAALLRAMGAVVVEAAPAQLGAAAVVAYLRLKQRARL